MHYDIEVTVLLSFVWLVGIVAFVWSAYCLMKCLRHTRIGKELAVKINPFSIFLESNFTEVGNVYRVKFLKYMNIGIVSVILGVVIALLAEPTRKTYPVGCNSESVLHHFYSTSQSQRGRVLQCHIIDE